MLGLTVCMPGGGHYGQLPSVLWIQQIQVILSMLFRIHICSVADPEPGSGVFGPWIGMVKKIQILDLGSGIRDEHPRSYFCQGQQFFGLKILEFFDADPVSCQPWIRDEKIGSGINIPDLQHGIIEFGYVFGLKQAEISIMFNMSF